MAAAVTPRTKAIILNSPSNPTGIVMTPAEVAAAVDVARRHGLLLISDEIYEPFLYDGTGGGRPGCRRRPGRTRTRSSSAGSARATR